jgi:hypothetical protein
MGNVCIYLLFIAFKGNQILLYLQYNGIKQEKKQKTFGGLHKNQYLCIAFEKAVYMGDPLAQLVEHHTFNVGVLGSNPKRITKT